MLCRTTPTENDPMNKDRIEGNWKELKGKARQKWGRLTDDDLAVIDGRREELIGRVQQRCGHAREQAEREVDDFCNTRAR